MKNNVSRLVAALLGCCAMVANAAVEEPVSMPAPCVLKVATGPKGKGYSKLFANVKAVCGASVSICEVSTEGGLNNLTALSANQADLGLVPVDTLQDMRDSDENIGALQAVMPLNNNLLHVATLAAGITYQGKEKWGGITREPSVTVKIAKFSELKGRPVALVGTAQILGRTLEKRLGYGMRFIDKDTDADALASMRKGEVVAVFSTSGWPSGVFSGLKQDSGITLIPYDLTAQAPYLVTKKNYQNLGVFNVPFLAVPNLLVTRPFKAAGPNGRNVATLQRCILDSLGDLQEGSYEPGWKEVKNTSETFGWPRFVPVSEGSAVPATAPVKRR